VTIQADGNERAVSKPFRTNVPPGDARQFRVLISTSRHVDAGNTQRDRKAARRRRAGTRSRPVADLGAGPRPRAKWRRLADTWPAVFFSCVQAPATAYHGHPSVVLPGSRGSTPAAIRWARPASSRSCRATPPGGSLRPQCGARQQAGASPAARPPYALSHHHVAGFGALEAALSIALISTGIVWCLTRLRARPSSLPPPFRGPGAPPAPDRPDLISRPAARHRYRGIRPQAIDRNANINTPGGQPPRSGTGAPFCVLQNTGRRSGSRIPPTATMASEMPRAR